MGITEQFDPNKKTDERFIRSDRKFRVSGGGGEGAVYGN